MCRALLSFFYYYFLLLDPFAFKVCADNLGTRAIPLHALMGRSNASGVCGDRRLSAALSLVTDVHHLNGGRQVTLRSVFRLEVGRFAWVFLLAVMSWIFRTVKHLPKDPFC